MDSDKMRELDEKLSKLPKGFSKGSLELLVEGFRYECSTLKEETDGLMHQKIVRVAFGDELVDSIPVKIRAKTCAIANRMFAMLSPVVGAKESFKMMELILATAIVLCDNPLPATLEEFHIPDSI